jgi:hypothetical protein
MQKHRHNQQPQQDPSPFPRLDENLLIRYLPIDGLLLVAKRRLLPSRSSPSLPFR